MKIKDIAQVLVALPQPYRKDALKKYNKWLCPSDLLKNNRLDFISEDNKLNAEENWLIQSDDIVIKRISPTFINLMSHNILNTYYSNNLIIIRAGDKIDVKYLACCLSGIMNDFSRRTSIGAVLPTISKKDLEEIEIKDYDLRKQKLIGEFWWQGLEKNKLYERLTELNNIKTEYMINKILNT